MGITQTDILQDVTFMGKDGTQFCIRPIRPDDASSLVAFHAQFSRENTSQGFISADTHNKAKYLTRMVYQSSFALVAVNEEDGNGQIVGVAYYDTIGMTRSESAEASICIQDSYRRIGVGSALIHELAVYALTQHIRAFTATISDQNSAILNFLRNCGLPTAIEQLHSGDLEIHVLLDVKPI